MAYAVLHLEKGKSVSGAIGTHIDRVEGKEFSYRHADKSRLHLNKSYKCTNYDLPLQNAIKNHIKKNYNGQRAVRKDAVTFVTYVLSGSHEQMKQIAKDEANLDAWIQKNYNFMAQEYGKENIVRFVLHMDERTPHIHAVIVPFTEDYRLSAKEVIGNKKDLEGLQDRYAEAMNEFGLKRGERRTGITHEDAKEYYTRMDKALNTPNEDLEVDKTFLGMRTGIDKDKTIEVQKEHIRALQTALTAEKEGNKQGEEIKLLASERYKKLERAMKSYRRIATSEENRNEVKEEIKKAIIREVKSYKFQGYSLTERERHKVFNAKIREYLKEKGIHGEVMTEVMKDEEFKKAERNFVVHPHDRIDKDRSRGRGI